MWSVTGLGEIKPLVRTSAIPLPSSKAPSTTSVLPGSQKREAKPSEITNGPLVNVGGWLFSPAGGSSTFRIITDGQGNLTGGDLTPSQWNFVKEQYQRLSDKMNKLYSSFSQALPASLFTTNYKGMRYNQDLATLLGGAWYLPIVSGDKPIAKTYNPVMGKDYGVFVEYLGGPGNFRITFKEIKKSWLEKIWEFLVNLVSTIVEFVSDIIDVLKGVLCAMARPAATELADIANGKVLTGKMYSKFDKMGIDANQLTKIGKGATAIEVEVAMRLVNAAFCAPPPSALRSNTVAAWDPSIASWRFASPKVPALPTQKPGSYIEYLSTKGSSATPPPGATVLSLPEYKRLTKAWFARPSTWMIVGGIAAVGGVGYYALR